MSSPIWIWWWQETSAGRYIAELAATRAEFPIDQFPLNPTFFIKHLTRLNFG